MRIQGTGADLPLPRVALVAASSYPLQHEQDELEDLREWPFPVSVDFAGPSVESRYAVARTVSQRVTSGGAALVLDSASGGQAWEPRPKVLRRDPDDGGLLWPFDGWWVWPDITGSFAGQTSFTVTAPVEWGTRGSPRRGEVLLTLTLREH